MTVSRETQRFAYRALLARWGQSINLSGPSHRTAGGFDTDWSDSVALVPHLPPNCSRIIDLGSGQGFPAIPIGISAGVAVELIESDRRKAAFLTVALAELGVDGRVHPVRIESARIDPAPCVTARALAPLQQLLAWAQTLVQPGGVALFLKGPGAQDEIEAARRSCEFQATILPVAPPRSYLVKVSFVR